MPQSMPPPGASGPDTARALTAAMVCAGAATAQFIAGKAVRDALYLSTFDITTLPRMVVATAVVSILLVAASSTSLRRLAPATFVPLAFAASAVLLLVEWGLVYAAPKAAAIVVYLQVSGVGPMLGSGFWLIASERFDPRTAKKHFGQIAGAGALGGLAALGIAAVLDVGAMLPVLAAINLFCAWQLRRLAHHDRKVPHAVEISAELSSMPPRSGLRVLTQAPYLRNLAALVLLGTAGAALVDYVFKGQAAANFGGGEGLLRFFATYYGGVSVMTFVVQASSHRFALEKLGLAVSAGTPSIALIAGGAGALIAPGLDSAMVVRGGESILRGSLFRSGYELFYTPIPPSEKRAAKSLIDVGCDRLGDAVGGVLIQLVLIVTPARETTTVLTLALGCASMALVFASRLNRGYIQTLERSLLDRAVELDLSDAQDSMTRNTMLRTLTVGGARRQTPPRPQLDQLRGSDPAAPRARAAGVLDGLDAEMLQILALRSGDRERVLRGLQSESALPATLVPHVIPLLAWDPVASEAVDALRRVAEERVGELIDALIDPRQDFAVRRRLARVFSVCASERAADGLVLGLDDQRFEVRFQCARSLVAIVEKNPRVRIDRDVMFEIVRREVSVSRPVWESHRLLNLLDDRDEHVLVDEFVKERASRSLAHVFTLLSLVLPADPLRVAFRGLHTEDPSLRGTSLEYLESVLPPLIRERLWPFLEDARPAGARATRPRPDILADLLRSHQSIVLNLQELQRRDTPDSKA